MSVKFHVLCTKVLVKACAMELDIFRLKPANTYRIMNGDSRDHHTLSMCLHLIFRCRSSSVVIPTTSMECNCRVENFTARLFMHDPHGSLSQNPWRTVPLCHRDDKNPPSSPTPDFSFLHTGPSAPTSDMPLIPCSPTSFSPPTILTTPHLIILGSIAIVFRTFS